MKELVSANVQLSNDNYLIKAKSRDHVLIVDEPVADGGQNKGPTPVELLLSAIGSCVAMTLRMYAERKGWDLGDITVNVQQHTLLTSEGIKKTLTEEIVIENEITDSQRKRLHTIAGKCPVAKMVQNETEINSIIK